MKKTLTLFACAMTAMALASCSNDEDVKTLANSDEIRFAPTSENGNTRAADVYCNANMPSQFKVYAISDGKVYINGDIIQKTSASTWENKSGTRYWPKTPVDFYAQVNGDDQFTWDGTSAPQFANFTVNNNVASQTDLLYAVKTNQTKSSSTSPAPVALNFHHALSQVVFYAKNTNPNIYVEVTGVSVGGVKNSGTYTFPTADTDGNVAHGTTTGTSSNGAQGSWALGTSTDVYDVTFPTVKLVGNQDNPTVMNLTDNTNLTAGSLGHGDETTNSFGNAMLLMPQGTFTALPVTDNGNGKLDLTKDGVYFKVLCTIYNVADTTATDLTNNVKIWDNKEIYIPVSGTWIEGMKYVYTLVFGEGKGGVDPDGPNPVLVPITYNVTVDEFIPINGSDIKLDY